jgi:hypothetical protein
MLFTRFGGFAGAGLHVRLMQIIGWLMNRAVRLAVPRAVAVVQTCRRLRGLAECWRRPQPYPPDNRCPGLTFRRTTARSGPRCFAEPCAGSRDSLHLMPGRPIPNVGSFADCAHDARSRAAVATRNLHLFAPILVTVVLSMSAGDAVLGALCTGLFPQLRFIRLDDDSQT